MDDFKEFTKGFRKKGFNRLLKLIRKYRVKVDVRAGWEQTADGIIPPPIPEALNVLANRPFTVSKISDTEVSVRTGKCHYRGNWTTPTFDASGEFGETKELTETKTLEIKVSVLTDGFEVPAHSLDIGWDIDKTYEGLPAQSYDIDFFGELITETHTDAEVIIPVAEVTFADGVISEIEQILDYNPVLPWNSDVITNITSGGSS